MLRAASALCLIWLLTSSLSAAIVYEPVRYQYRDVRYDRPVFYYGGTNPLVLAAGRNLQYRYNASVDPASDISVSLASEGRFGYNLLHHGLIGSPHFVYTDALPAGVIATPYGFDEADARNEAYANVPLYFRKADILAFAWRAPDGSVVVPPQAPPPGTIVITPSRGPTTQPASQPAPQPILIIPKRLLNKPLQAAPASVAAAQ